MDKVVVVGVLHRYVSEEILGGDDEDLDGSTRLLETGIIDSMAMVGLVAHIENALRVQIPDDHVVPRNFATLDSLADLVIRLSEREPLVNP